MKLTLRGLALVACACAMTTAFAAGETGVIGSPINFESFTNGTLVVNNGGDTQDSISVPADDAWWKATGDNASYVSDGTDLPVGDKVPDHFKSSTNDKYLRVMTSGELKRSVEAFNGAEDANPTGTDIVNSTIYIDTLVQFTTSDEPPVADAADKLVFWVDQASNLWVSAGTYLNDSEGTTNLVIKGNMSLGWHRLTVRMMVKEGCPCAFFIYLDGSILSSDGMIQTAINRKDYDEFLDTISDDDINAGRVFTPYTQTTARDNLKYLVASGDGGLDDIVFTYDDPAFVSGGSIEFTLALGENVTGVSYAIGSDAAVAITATTKIEGVSAGDTLTISEGVAAAWYTIAGVEYPAGTTNLNTITIGDGVTTGTVVAVAMTQLPPTVQNDFTNVTVEAFSKLETWAKDNNLTPNDLDEAMFDDYLMNVAPNSNPVITIQSIVENGDNFDITVIAKTATNADIELASGAGDVSKKSINGTILVTTMNALGETPVEKSVTVTFDDTKTAKISVPKANGKFIRAKIK